LKEKKYFKNIRNQKKAQKSTSYTLERTPVTFHRTEFVCQKKYKKKKLYKALGTRKIKVLLTVVKHTFKNFAAGTPS